MHKHVRQIDTNTGEYLENGVLVYFPQRPKTKDPFHMSFEKGNDQLADLETLTATDYRVLHHLLARLDYENFINVTHAAIAQRLRLQRPNVSRAIKHLVEHGIIIKGPQVGRTTTYRLSTTIGWKGRVKNLNEYRNNQLRTVIDNTKKNDNGAA